MCDFNEAELREPEWCHHDFCDALRINRLDVGGDAYRDWHCCMYHKGVLMGYHNHRWFVSAASDPTLKCERATCHNSREWGCTMPKLIGGDWVSVQSVPWEAHPRFLDALCEAKGIMWDAIHEIQAQRAADKAKKKQAFDDKRKQVSDAWTAAEAKA